MFVLELRQIVDIFIDGNIEVCRFIVRCDIGLREGF
jgi:hypothetical protein